MNISRRGFIGAGGAFSLMAGCRSTSLFGTPDLVFGVVSDIHITTPESCRLFRKSLRYFKRRGVDAVMAPGDLTDWGNRSAFVYLKRTWDEVFGGTDVKPLFCTGNHDWDGWWYSDMIYEMHANGVSEEEAMTKLGFKETWREVMGEDIAPVRVRSVKGYDFVSVEWNASDKLAPWMAANAGRFKGDKPFFFFQHVPIRGTTGDSFGWADGGLVKPVLDDFSNCVAFTGHTHVPFYNERLIWQDTFTAISAPSLSYASLPGCENGGGRRDGKSKQAMTLLPMRRDLRGGQGFIVKVWSDRIAVERIDLEEEACDCPEWVIPLGAGAGKPYDPAVTAKRVPVPEFPLGAKVEVETRNTENRSGKWTIVMNCEFPSACIEKGFRVYDYQIRAVPLDGSDHPMVKRFISPAFAKMAKYEPARQRFWFDVAELPQDKRYVLAVSATNCFGKQSKPIFSKVMRSEPGLGTVNREGIKDRA